ncbi:MAG: hypothetical protein HYX59_01480 [Elusimicrobia bacterium]|nr:hypothetical protein [Elusimicrobiota bacterium]
MFFISISSPLEMLLARARPIGFLKIQLSDDFGHLRLAFDIVIRCRAVRAIKRRRLKGVRKIVEVCVEARVSGVEHVAVIRIGKMGSWHSFVKNSLVVQALNGMAPAAPGFSLRENL